MKEGESVSVEFFSKRSKRGFSFSLAQRKEVKETSTLTKLSPILKGCNLLWGETALRKGFGKIHRACAPTG